MGTIISMKISWNFDIDLEPVSGDQTENDDPDENQGNRPNFPSQRTVRQMIHRQNPKYR